MPELVRQPRSIGIAPGKPRPWMRPGGRLELRVWLAEAADPVHGRETLLKRYETAILAATSPAALISAPGIVLRFRRLFETEDGGGDCRKE